MPPGFFFDRESLHVAAEEFQSRSTVYPIHTEHEIFSCSVVNKVLPPTTNDLVSELIYCIVNLSLGMKTHGGAHARMEVTGNPHNALESYFTL